jgi:hypothetical protein
MIQSPSLMNEESIQKLAAGQPPEGFIENPTGQHPLKATHPGCQTNI